MINILISIWDSLVRLAMLIPIVCYSFSFVFRQFLTSKVMKNKYTNLIPLFSMIIGIVIMFSMKMFLPKIDGTVDRLVLGAIFGLSSTGFHQLIKRMKSFVTMTKFEKVSKENRKY